MNNNQFPVQQSPIPKYSGEQNSLLQQALAHLPGSFPQPLLTLQSNLNYIPHYLINQDLYKQIHSFNRKLILDQFQFLADIAIELWLQTKQNISSIDPGQFLHSLCQKLSNLESDGSYYCIKISQIANLLTKCNSPIHFMSCILRCLAFSNLQYFGLAINKGVHQNSLRQQQQLPQKYEKVIQLKLNQIMQPAKNNYFEQLIMNPIQKHNKQEQVLKTRQQIEAQQAADMLTDFFNIRRGVDSGQILKKQKSLKRGNSTITFLPFVISRGKKNGCAQQPTTTSIPQYQNLLNTLILSIEQQQLGQPTNIQQQERKQKQQQIVRQAKLIQPRNVEFENRFTNTFSQMTYYQSYMMAHMADLIFLNTGKFDFRLIRKQPYLSCLSNQIQEQMHFIKSEATSFNILMQSTQRYTINQPSLSCSQKQGIGTNLLDKAKNRIQGLYKKAKQQLKKNREQKQEVTEIKYNPQLYVHENQNLFIPFNPNLVQHNFTNIILQLENVHNFVLKVIDLQTHTHSSSVPIFDTIRNFADQLKNKIFHDDTPYYHEVQSWMAIVMLLFKQLAMNAANNYHYNPYKRRTIIKICRRIFIQQQKLKASKQRPSQVHFKNWPVVLKFLQNNRPEILSDSQGSVNQKQVQKIIQQIYMVIRQKRLLGSTFGNLFQGIQQVKQNLPQIKLVCLSNGSNAGQSINKDKPATQCKVVHILISGFLSEDTDKFDEWADMIQTMPDSEIYALVWESSTIKNLVKFFLKSAVDIIGAIKMIDQLRRKYTDNPFNPAFQVAQLTGRILAQLIICVFPNRFVNVCGYSLGSEVIKQFVRRMIEKRQSHLINNIYIMGGVSDSIALAELVSRAQVPLSLFNCYTNSDLVLKHLLSLCKPGIKPVGLHEVKRIQGHSIINIDCTKFISGHLAFRSNMRLMGEILQLSMG